MFARLYKRYLRYKLKNKGLKEFDKFVPNFRYGKVIKVYDGDTITIGVYYLKHYYKFSIRLVGIDAPELRTTNKVEREAGLIVRDRLADKIMGKYIDIDIKGYDKYGRVLGNIFLEGENICEWLLNKKLVIKYDGGRKEETDWNYIVSSS